MERLLARITNYDASTSTWISNKKGDLMYHSMIQQGGWEEDESPQPPVSSLSLQRGGRITVYANLVSESRSTLIQQELFAQSDLFRQYQVLGNNEAKLQWLLHQDATIDDDDRQPGFIYANGVTMKAKALEMVPHLEELSRDMAKLCAESTSGRGVSIQFSFATVKTNCIMAAAIRMIEATTTSFSYLWWQPDQTLKKL
jgi:hypothetical protein